jgi:hypothetical protein
MATIFRRSNGMFYIPSTFPDGHRFWKYTGIISQTLFDYHWDDL